MTQKKVATTSARHLAFIVNNYPPKTGGVELHVSSLAQTLARSGVDVTVFALDNSAAGETIENGVRVIRLPCTRMIGNVLAFPLPGTAKRIWKQLRDFQVDVVSVHTRFFPMTYIGVRAARNLNIPAILTEHGSDHVRGVGRLVGAASKVVDITLGRYVLRKCTRVLAISEAAQSFVWRLASVHAAIFRNAIDIATFARVASSDSKRRKLVFLGRLVPGKGWEHTLDVAKALVQDQQYFELHFIGDGPDKAALARACQQAGLGELVRIHGRLSLHEIAAHLNGAVLLNPTLLAEGFQTTLLEAIASRAVVISTPVAAARYLQSLGAPIELVGAEDLSGWVQKAREYLNGEVPSMNSQILDQFDWSVRAREYETLMEELIPTQQANLPRS